MPFFNIHQTQEIVDSTEIYDLGESYQIDVKTLLPNIDYTKLTLNNFIVCGTGAGEVQTGGGQQVDGGCKVGGFYITKNYNPSTGILNISNYTNVLTYMHGGGHTAAQSSQNINTHTYLVVGTIKSLPS